MINPYFFLGISIFLTVTAHLLLKKGMTLVGPLDFSFSNLVGLILQIFQNVYLFFGLAVFGIAFFSWLFALSKIQLHIMYPISVGLNFSLITIVSWLLFKESLTLYQITGIAVIISGIFLLVKP